MKKTQIIGDIHLDDRYVSYLDFQVQTIKKLIDSENCEDIIFLGDLFEKRSPSPKVLLALQEILDYVPRDKKVYLLRGNHCSQTKADDGLTALSLFEYKRNVTIIKHTRSVNGYTFIPHYENERTIIDDLCRVPDTDIMFGHFGYNGCLNPAGDPDFSISPDMFTSRSFLGHIHHFKEKDNITIVGTPYTTSFQEANKDSYYAVLDSKGNYKMKPINFGIRHLIMNLEDLPNQKQFIEDPKYFTLLRVMIDTLDKNQDNIREIIDHVKPQYLDIKYKPVVDEKKPQSTFNTNEVITKIDESLILDYINNTSTTLGKQELLDGLRLINENKSN
jgi:DNA repair exonuclease SbcCD nuclease subunit